ncbi:hypothetical protein ACQUEW_12140, partial [Enterococcus casseliflavus]
NLSQNLVHSDPDLILHNSSVLIDKEPFIFPPCSLTQISFFYSAFMMMPSPKWTMALSQTEEGHLTTQYLYSKVRSDYYLKSSISHLNSVFP